MNEQDKTMQYCFYAGVLILFVFGFCYFSTSHTDEQRSTDVRSRIDDSKAINTKLQRTNQTIQVEVRESIDRLGTAEAELSRAECSIERCESILETAKRRAQKADTQTK